MIISIRAASQLTSVKLLCMLGFVGSLLTFSLNVNADPAPAVTLADAEAYCAKSGNLKNGEKAPDCVERMLRAGSGTASDTKACESQNDSYKEAIKELGSKPLIAMTKNIIKTVKTLMIIAKAKVFRRLVQS